jgi:hypothetical protein
MQPSRSYKNFSNFKVFQNLQLFIILLLLNIKFYVVFVFSSRIAGYLRPEIADIIEDIHDYIRSSFVLTCLLGYVAVILFSFSLGCTVYSFCVDVYIVSVPRYDALLLLLAIVHLQFITFHFYSFTCRCVR